jgi:hypothetical protein
MQISLCRFDDSRKVRSGDPTPAYSPVFDKKFHTALVEVHWARRAKAMLPQISGPQLVGEPHELNK